MKLKNNKFEKYCKNHIDLPSNFTKSYKYYKKILKKY